MINKTFFNFLIGFAVIVGISLLVISVFGNK